MKNKTQQELFDGSILDWENYYIDMPEYNNINLPPPFITATFKFRSEEDYNIFHENIKKYIYKTNKVFDGMQRENHKQAWFPLNEKASKYECK